MVREQAATLEEANLLEAIHEAIDKLGELHAEGFRVVGILDPGLPADPEFAPTAEGLAGGHFVLDAAGYFTS